MCLNNATFKFVDIFQAYTAWQDNPVLTTVKSTSYPVNKVEFPALTICGQGSNEVVLNTGILEHIYFALLESSKVITTQQI